MSDLVVDDDVDDEEEGGSALIRVLRRSLNMKRGRTEKPRIRRSPQGWSTRGQALVDRFDELIAIYDRIHPLLEPVMDDDDADDLVNAYDDMVNAIDGLTATQVDNSKDARERKKTLVAGEIVKAQKLEADVEDYLADNGEPTRSAVRKLLTSGSPAAKRLLDPANKGRLEALIDKLPKTERTAKALEGIEDQLIEDLSTGEPWGVTPELHEVFFKAKTDMFEGAIAKKVKKSKNPKLAGLKDLPKDEYWRMLMDGNSQDKDDKHYYDRSFGYMASMMKGMNTIVDKIDEPMSIDFVKEMHQCATYQVTTETKKDIISTGIFQEQGLKKAPNGWGCCHDFSDEGLEQLKAMRDEMNELVPGYFADDEPAVIKGKNVPKFKAAEGLRGQPPDQIQAAVEQLMQATIDTYETEIKNAKRERTAAAKEDKTLAAIIDCCRKLGQIHPFKDANGRLNMFLLLNKMLLENQLDPTILPDQGLMIGRSCEELIELIKAGQQTVRDLKS